MLNLVEVSLTLRNIYISDTEDGGTGVEAIQYTTGINRFSNWIRVKLDKQQGNFIFS